MAQSDSLHHFYSQLTAFSAASSCRFSPKWAAAGLEELFRPQRTDREHGLDSEQTTNEDLRQALRRYRSFFDRLLSL